MHVQSMSRAGHRRRKAMLRAHSAIGLALLALTHVARRQTTRDTPMLQLCDPTCPPRAHLSQQVDLPYISVLR